MLVVLNESSKPPFTYSRRPGNHDWSNCRGVENTQLYQAIQRQAENYAIS
jgi:hypothetical protein